MRTRKKSITKHKRLQLQKKKIANILKRKSKKHITLAGYINDLINLSKADKKLAMVMKFRAANVENVNKQLESDLKVYINRFLTTEAMLLCMLSGEEEAKVFNKADISEAIQKIQNNDIALEVNQTDDKIWFQLVYAKKEDKKDEKITSR